MKLKKMLLVLLFSLFFQNSFVNAANDIVYDIDSLSVNNKTMTMTGYSFIDHADNYGGKNLETYFIVYVGNWTNVVGSDNSISRNEILNCVGLNGTNNKCMAFKTTPAKIDGKVVDLYTLRCIKEACYKKYQDARKTRLANGKESFLDSKCTHKNVTNGGKKYPDSHCFYYNVGFTSTINLVNVYKHFSQFSNNSIHIRIASVVKVKRTSGTNSGKQVYIARESSLGVSKSAVKNPTTYSSSYYNIPINFEIEVNGKKRTYKSISFKGISNQYYQTAGSSKPRTDYKMTKAGKYYMDQYKYFTINESYNSNGFFKGRTKENATYNKYAVKVDYNRSIYTKIYAVKGKADDGKDRIVPATTKTYFVPAGWGKVSGDFVIKNDSTTYEEEVTPEPSCICIGSNCVKPASCSDTTSYSPKKCTGEVGANQCKSSFFPERTNPDEIKKFSCLETFNSNSNTYYVKILASTLNNDLKTANTTIIDAVQKGATPTVRYGSGANGVELRTEGSKNYYYIPMNFHANAQYFQYSTLTINDFNNGSNVNSGRFFKFSLNYTINASWQHASYATNVGSNNWYDKSAQIKYKYDLAGVTQYKTLIIYFDLKPGVDMIYKKNGDNFVSLKEYGNSVDGVYYDVVNNSNPSDKINDSTKLQLDVIYPDSNKLISSGITNKVGTFSCDAVRTISSKEFEHSCNYTIPQAWLDVSDGSVYYSNEKIEKLEEEESGGMEESTEEEFIEEEDDTRGEILSNGYRKMTSGINSYYIPYSMKTGETFQFTISSSNLSLIDGVNWGHNGICTVTAQKSKLKYRTIDTSNPFPKANAPYADDMNKIASNWKSYYDKYGNFSRIIDNSFSNISYRTYIFDNEKKKKIASLDSTYGTYGKFNDMDKDSVGSGNSKVISDKSLNLFEIANGKHCGSASFSDDCDKVQ